MTRRGYVQAELKKSAVGQEDGPMAWLWKRSREMARDIWLVLRVRSFQLIVLQVSAMHLGTIAQEDVSTCGLHTPVLRRLCNRSDLPYASLMHATSS